MTAKNRDVTTICVEHSRLKSFHSLSRLTDRHLVRTGLAGPREKHATQNVEELRSHAECGSEK